MKFEVKDTHKQNKNVICKAKRIIRRSKMWYALCQDGQDSGQKQKKSLSLLCSAPGNTMKCHYQKQNYLPLFTIKQLFFTRKFHISPHRGHGRRETAMLQHNLPAITRFTSGLFEIRDRFGVSWDDFSLIKLLSWYFMWQLYYILQEKSDIFVI